MANIIEAPVEVTKIAARTAATGGRLVRDVSGNLFHRVQPGYIPADLLAEQAIIRQFEHRFGVVDLIDKDSLEDELSDRAYSAADALVDEGVVNQHTIVELRPLLPEDALEDPKLNERRERAVELLQLAFEEDHNVMAIPNPHPIMPSRHDSPLDIEATWRVLTPELDGLERQLRDDGNHEPAMLVITGPSYEQAMFGGHIAATGGTETGKLLVLEEVGELPKDNRFVIAG